MTRISELDLSRLSARGARLFPERVAVEQEDGSTLTYIELDELVVRTARTLTDACLRPGAIVTVRVRGRTAGIIALLAAWRAELTPAPVPWSSPRPYHRAVVERTRAVAELEDGPLGVTVRPFRSPSTAPIEPPRAYLMSTSGSSGPPKVVAVGHEALTRHLEGAAATFGYTADDRCLLFHSVGFDAMLEEAFTPLVVGAAVLDGGASTPTPRAFGASLDQRGVTVLQLPTPYWRLASQVGERAASRWSGLRAVIVGSEAMQPNDVWEWRARSAFEAVSLFNAYGPTEAVITSHAALITADTDCSNEVPVGTPLPGHEEALDVDGELQLGGTCLAVGYLDADVTERGRFRVVGGRRWYASGDRMLRRSDGALAFIGRADRQVQVKGHRVELSGVESTLLLHPEVIVARVDLTGTGALRATVALAAASEATVEELRDHLATHLPAPMVPADIDVVPASGLTPGWKVQRDTRAAGADRYGRQNN